MITHFTIFGERCSGTNFLESSMLQNFKINVTYKFGWKHWFGSNNFDLKDINSDNVLFLGIVREPISWIDSFYKKKHHVPFENRNNLHAFLNNEWYSTYENKELMGDRNYKTKNRYKNIFELRKMKNDYLTQIMKTKVKHYLLIRYEDLSNFYEKILSFIEHKFNLERKNKKFIKIKSYKGYNQHEYIKKKIILNKKIIKYIKNNLDKKQENELGYMR